jgi:hypothetical protein
VINRSANHFRTGVSLSSRCVIQAIMNSNAAANAKTILNGDSGDPNSTL